MMMMMKRVKLIVIVKVTMKTTPKTLQLMLMLGLDWKKVSDLVELLLLSLLLEQIRCLVLKYKTHIIQPRTLKKPARTI